MAAGGTDPATLEEVRAAGLEAHARPARGVGAGASPRPRGKDPAASFRAVRPARKKGAGKTLAGLGGGGLILLKILFHVFIAMRRH